MKNKLPTSIQNYIKNLERMRQDFVANVSHELRTPLTVIQGYLEILLQQQPDAVLNKIYSQMQQQSIRMSHLIEDLLLLSHLEIDDHLTEEHEIKVSEMLQTIIYDAENISGSKQHKVSLVADSNILVIGAANELRSLFSNIIFNAIKYTPAKGKIDIEWKCDNKNRAIFSVKDTGIGIAKEHIPRITERFYRIDKARSRESGGTGLGLAIVKHVLLRHQGKLVIESKVKKGSTFKCIFPAERTIIK